MESMVEVRAIVRVAMLERVVRCLKDAGVPRLSVTHVRAVGAGADPAAAHLSPEEGAATAEKALVQFICAGERCELLVELLVRTARTGRRGDGIVSVYPVLSVTKIRTGATGLEALR